MKNKVTITNPPDAPVPVEVIADSILKIAEGIKKLRSGPLNDRALVLLIVNACPSTTKGRFTQKKYPTAAEVKAVLAGIEGLSREYLKN